jgi:hypothetical protein
MFLAVTHYLFAVLCLARIPEYLTGADDEMQAPSRAIDLNHLAAFVRTFGQRCRLRLSPGVAITQPVKLLSLLGDHRESGLTFLGRGDVGANDSNEEHGQNKRECMHLCTP